MTAATARTAPRPRTWVISGWAATARPTTGVVTVTTVWADEREYYPVHAVPYTPAKHFPKERMTRRSRTKLAIGAELVARARDAGFVFRAVCADSAHGDQDGSRGELADAGLPFVMALKPRRGTWPGPDAHTL
jgi:SRSO17 transposase